MRPVWINLFLVVWATGYGHGTAWGQEGRDEGEERSDRDAVQEWSPDDLIPAGYNRMKVPRIDGDPVTVSVTINLTQILAVNEAEQSFSIDIIYEECWSDPRLNFPPKSNQSYTLASTFKTKIWVPDLYFTNALTSNNVQPVALYFELDSNSSHVKMSSRLIVRLSCDMDLFYFPHDSQECSIDLTSLTVPKKHQRLNWKRFILHDGKEFPKFETLKYTTGTCASMRGPDYPCITVRIKLFRRMSYYVIRIYGPSFLLVITAFVGFWVPPMGYPARIALIVTPLLALITQQTQINAEVNVSYVVALHIWMIFSTFFVFMSLIEYAFCIIYSHRVDEKKEMIARDPIGMAFRSSWGSGTVSHWIKELLTKTYGEIDYMKAPMDRNKVDYFSRLLFPFVYLIFILLYSFVFVVPWAISKYA